MGAVGIVGLPVFCASVAIADANARAAGRLTSATPIAQSSCLWTGPSDTAFDLTDPLTNVAFPDTGAVYWSAEFTLPAGATLELDGQFAHARYQSLTAYSLATGIALSAVDDVATQPAPGSSNPYLPGADRTANLRSYTITVVDGRKPAQPAQNTIYAAAAGQTTQVLVYRVYLPDSFTPSDVTGGVGLPNPVLHLAGGSTLTGAAACQAIDAASTPLATPAPHPGIYDLWRNQSGEPATFPASATPTFTTQAPAWMTLECIFTGECGDYGNPDNAYMSAYVNRGFPAGPVLVLRGQLPTTPVTGPGVATVTTGQLRYWSICQYSLYTTAVAGCADDSNIPLDANRDYTIVSSLPQDRPGNATTQCGVAWIPWPAAGDGLGHLNDGLLVVRNMLPAAGFTNAIQDVTSPSSTVAVLGPYYPQGSYTTTTAFQQLGCPV